MEHLLDTMMNYADHAHFILFGLILLAGLNVPISLDVVVFTGGALAGTVVPENTTILFLFLWLACQIAAYECYCIGRFVGPGIYKIKWFNKIIYPERIDKLHTYYEKFGFLTFLVGRFIPGGVRNALFLTAGLGKMPFSTFVLRDLLSCILSVSFLFYLGYSFGQHYTYIVQILTRYQTAGLITLCSLITLYTLVRLLKRSNKKLNGSSVQED